MMNKLIFVFRLLCVAVVIHKYGRNLNGYSADLDIGCAAAVVTSHMALQMKIKRF